MCPQAQLSGLHARSETLIQLTRDYDRGHASLSAVEDQIKIDTQRLIELQKKLGFEYLTDGGLAWQDPLRPLTNALNGVVTGIRYSRWFDTNTFYQKPIVSSKVSPKYFDPLTFLRTDLLPRGGEWKVSIPGPYTFSELSENNHYRDRSELVLDVARAQHEIILRLGRSGVSLVQLSEPCLVYRPYREDAQDTSELELASNAINIVAENAPLAVDVHTFFGNATPVLPGLLETNVAGVGFDAYETSLENLEFETGKRLLLGVVDARESFVEDPSWIADTAAKLSKRVEAAEWVLAPSTDLKYLPRDTADRKAEALARATSILRENS